MSVVDFRFAPFPDQGPSRARGPPGTGSQADGRSTVVVPSLTRPGAGRAGSPAEGEGPSAVVVCRVAPSPPAPCFVCAPPASVRSQPARSRRNGVRIRRSSTTSIAADPPPRRGKVTSIATVWTVRGLQNFLASCNKCLNLREIRWAKGDFWIPGWNPIRADSPPSGRCFGSGPEMVSITGRGRDRGFAHHLRAFSIPPHFVDSIRPDGSTEDTRATLLLLTRQAGRRRRFRALHREEGRDALVLPGAGAGPVPIRSGELAGGRAGPDGGGAREGGRRRLTGSDPHRGQSMLSRHPSATGRRPHFEGDNRLAVGGGRYPGGRGRDGGDLQPRPEVLTSGRTNTVRRKQCRSPRW